MTEGLFLVCLLVDCKAVEFERGTLNAENVEDLCVEVPGELGVPDGVRGLLNGVSAEDFGV